MFCPYLRVVKDRLSSRLSIKTPNNFGGIVGKMFNFGTDQLFLSGDSKQKTISPDKKWYFFDVAPYWLKISVT